MIEATSTHDREVARHGTRVDIVGNRLGCCRGEDSARGRPVPDWPDASTSTIRIVALIP